MNCERFEEHIIAFVDEALDESVAADAGRHAEGCAACNIQAENVRALKQSVRRVVSGASAPAGLSDRIRSALGEESRRGESGGARTSSPPRWIVPLAMAAAIGFVWLVSPLIFEDSTTGIGEVRPVEARWVSALRNRHHGCCGMGDAHHRKAMSRDLTSVKAVLGKELGHAVLAPNLEAAGYRFHSADTCGFAGRPGAHLIYERISDGRLISVFSVALMDTREAGRGVSGRQRGYVVCDSPESAAVIAWDDAGATYLICGKTPAGDLITLADTIG